MARKALEEGLNEIRNNTIKLGELTKEAIIKSVESLKNRDIEMAEKVMELEEKSDIINLEIDEDALRMTALQQPVAKDLRFISAMIKISDNFERICDLAEKIAHITIKYKEKKFLKPLIDIPRMASVIAEMIDIDLEAIENDTSPSVDKLIEKDDLIDNLYIQIYNELISFMIRDPKNIDDATDLLFVARHLERIGDIAAKTGAKIVYMVEGKRVWIK